MKTIAMAALIIHNIIVESYRSSHTSDGTVGRSARVVEAESESDMILVPPPPATIALQNSFLMVSDDIKIKVVHRDLKSAFIEHLWNFLVNN